MAQRTDEWFRNLDRDYFARQLEKPYRSTVRFCDWLESEKVIEPGSSQSIADVGAGNGANVCYMGRRYPCCRFTGLELNPAHVEEGTAAARLAGLGNVGLEQADLYALPPRHAGAYDGVVSYQTLSWLPDLREPLERMAPLARRWLALTSLFFDGDINARIEIEEYGESLEKPVKSTFYNTYSLRLARDILTRLGFSRIACAPFEIDIDLPRPAHARMGTHTERLESGKRLQISGPLLMSWYFVLGERDRGVRS